MNTQQNTTGNAVTERQQAINKRRSELTKQFRIQPGLDASIEASKERIAKVREELAKLNELEKSNKEIPLESLDSTTVNDYTTKVQKDFAESGEWASSERMAKSLRGITPRYESHLNHYLQSKYTVKDLEDERLGLIRELQDYGIQCSKTSTYEEIKTEVSNKLNYNRVAKGGIGKGDIAVDAVREHLQALDVATGVKKEETKKPVKKTQSIGGWTYLVTTGYYLTFYSPKSLPLLYSIHNGKTSCRVICQRNTPATAVSEGGTCFRYETAKRIGKAEFDKILTNKPCWTQIALAYDLQLPMFSTDSDVVCLFIDKEQYTFNFEDASIVF